MERNSMLAHPNIRYISTIFDGFILMVLLMPLMFLNKFMDDTTLVFNITTFLYTGIVYLIIDVVIPVCTKGQTIGRYMFNLRIVKQDFTLASWKEYSVRASIFIVIGFLSQVLLLTTVSYVIWMIVFIVSIYLIYKDELRQTVHDKFAKTVVVFDKEFSKGTN